MIQLRPHQARIVDSMSTNPKGQVIVPTGGGKTLCMIKDTQRLFNSGNKWGFILKKSDRKTIVVVSPRILLAQQHSEEYEQHLKLNLMLQKRVLHVHSGRVNHTSTTNPDAIRQWNDKQHKFNKLIFTTYHSLHRIQESGIKIDTIYFDEAHNSVQKHFYPATRFYATLDNIRCYFFTATPKYNKSEQSPSMDQDEIYGAEIERIKPIELIENGYILPPKFSVKELQMTESGRTSVARECEHLIETIDEISVNKVLVCARRTSQIVNLIDETDFCKELASRGYSWMYITSKTGAYIDGSVVSRQDFFDTLTEWGENNSKKFIVLHHSILSEGINVPGLEAALFMRNMNNIAISQTIGRVIRTGDAHKRFGVVCVPVYDRVGIKTSRSVGRVVDTILKS